MAHEPEVARVKDKLTVPKIQYYPDEATRWHTLELCRQNLYFLGKVILGYKDAAPEPHERMCQFWTGPGKKKMIVGARGLYKTSFCTVARIIQVLLNDPNARILLLMNTLINARKKGAEILGHFDRNERLRQLVPHYWPEMKRAQPWSSSAIQINRSGIYPEPSITVAGVDSQLASGHYTSIYLDDPVAAERDDMKEDGLIIIKPEEVDKAIGMYKILEGLCINTPDPAKKTDINILVNRWAVQDFAAYIMDHDLRSNDNPGGVDFLQLAVHKEDGSLLWPDGLSERKLNDIKRAQGEFMYWTQYECKPYNPSDRGFPVENLSRYSMLWTGKRPVGWERMNVYALMDLADARNAASCRTALIIVYVDNQRHLWVTEAVSEKLDPLAKIDLIHRMVKEYGLRTVHIEENLHNNMLQFSLQSEMKRRGESYRVEPLKHRNRDKDSRILRLQPWYEQGAIHLKAEQRQLLREMRDFPFTHDKDTLDALAYIIDIVRYPPKSGPVAGNSVDPNLWTVRQAMDEMKRGKAKLSWGQTFGSQHRATKPSFPLGVN
jgi:predicted phage terminase large subunit-like protein